MLKITFTDGAVVHAKAVTFGKRKGKRIVRFLWSEQELLSTALVKKIASIVSV